MHARAVAAAVSRRSTWSCSCSDSLTCFQTTSKLTRETGHLTDDEKKTRRRAGRPISLCQRRRQSAGAGVLHRLAARGGVSARRPAPDPGARARASGGREPRSARRLPGRALTPFCHRPAPGLEPVRGRAHRMPWHGMACQDTRVRKKRRS